MGPGKGCAPAQRIQTLNQLRHLVFTGPESIRVRFKDRYQTGLVTEAAAMRPRKGSDPVAFTTNTVIRSLARRIQPVGRTQPPYVPIGVLP